MRFLFEKKFLLVIIGIMSAFFLSSVICGYLIVSDVIRKEPEKKKRRRKIIMKCPECGYSTDPEFVLCPRCGKFLTNEKGERI